MHYLLLGPSGVGKTMFGNWLEANRQYDHLAVDRGDETDGLTAEGLIALWNKVIQEPYWCCIALTPSSRRENASVEKRLRND
jgi:hypothetical protein